MRSIHELYQVEFSDGVKGALGIDERGQLYWNGDPVITGRKVLLPWWVDLSLVIGSLSLFVIAAPLAWSYLAPLI